MAVNILDIDPKNLSHDFRRDWEVFRGSRIKKFLVALLRKEEHELRIKLENVLPEDLGKLQGSVKTVQKLIVIVEQSNPEATLKEVLEYLEKK